MMKLQIFFVSYHNIYEFSVPVKIRLFCVESFILYWAGFHNSWSPFYMPIRLLLKNGDSTVAWFHWPDQGSRPWSPSMKSFNYPGILLCFVWNKYNRNVQTKFTTVRISNVKFFLAFSFRKAYSEAIRNRLFGIDHSE